MELEKNSIFRRPYWNYDIYRFAKLELTGGHIEIMLFVELENLVFSGGHIEVMLFIEMGKK